MLADRVIAQEYPQPLKIAHSTMLLRRPRGLPDGGAHARYAPVGRQSSSSPSDLRRPRPFACSRSALARLRTCGRTPPFQALRDDFVLLAAVPGPVERCHGCHWRISSACKSRWSARSGVRRSRAATCSRSVRARRRICGRTPPFHALRDDFALPAAVRGPVDRSHGRHRRIARACKRRWLSVR